MSREGHSISKRWLAWLESPLTKDIDASSVSWHLRKRRNMDFLLGDSDVIMDIPVKHPSKMSEGINEEAT